MRAELLFVGPRSVTLQAGEGLYALENPVEWRLSDGRSGTLETVISSLYGLWPDTEYTLTLSDGTELRFHTAQESCTLDVRRFGAVGDGEHDDTPALQAALTVCPPDGRVLIPKGQYRTGPLFLKSHIRVEIQRGATLLLKTDRSEFPILPGITQSTDEQSDWQLGAWEGNPLDSFAAMLTAVDCEDVILYGEGLLDGQAQQSDWWQHRLERLGAYRGRMLFTNRCRNVTVQGLSFQNSPAWNLHPFRSEALRFYNVRVSAPADSPNTDGFDPECCEDVKLLGAHFSLGDDCIAIKSGKLYLGKTWKQPCKNLEIAHCLMENGHGGVTIGSESAGGVQQVWVHHCLMRDTDRGLRVKTRRGRGEQGVIDDITFSDVRMERVGTPLVVNALYFCDPDGHTARVQDVNPRPVDEGTPRVGTVTFQRVRADGAACAGFVLGLPERPVERVALRDVEIDVSPDAKLMQPAMADCVGRVKECGLVLCNVDQDELTNVRIRGQRGPEVRRCRSEEWSGQPFEQSEEA